MSKESTNVELEPITVVGGEIISDGKQKTEIPPEGKLEKNSLEDGEGIVTLKLSGEWPPRETLKEEKDEELGIGE